MRGRGSEGHPDAWGPRAEGCGGERCWKRLTQHWTQELGVPSPGSWGRHSEPGGPYCGEGRGPDRGRPQAWCFLVSHCTALRTGCPRSQGWPWCDPQGPKPFRTGGISCAPASGHCGQVERWKQRPPYAGTGRLRPLALNPGVGGQQGFGAASRHRASHPSHPSVVVTSADADIRNPHLKFPGGCTEGQGQGQVREGVALRSLLSGARLPAGSGPGGLRAPGQAAMKAFVSQQMTACGPSSTAAADRKSCADVTERNLLVGEWITPWATAHTRLRPRAGRESIRPSPHSATIPLQTPTDGDRPPRGGPAPASGLACPRTWWTLWTPGDGADRGAARGHPAPSLTCASGFRVRPRPSCDLAVFC